MCAAAVTANLLVTLLASSALGAGPSLTAAWSGLGAAPKKTPAELVLTVTLERGWHLNAHDPDRPYLIPTTLEIDPPSGTMIESIRYPEAVVRSLAFAPGMPLRLYEGAFTIVVRIAGAMPPRFDARLGYQACNDEKCLPPSTLLVPFDGATSGPKPATAP